MSNRLSLFVAGGAFVLCSMSASAQTITGAITGSVTDPSGSAVPNAKVVATDTGKNQKYDKNQEKNHKYDKNYLLLDRTFLRTEDDDSDVLKKK